MCVVEEYHPGSFCHSVRIPDARDSSVPQNGQSHQELVYRWLQYANKQHCLIAKVDAICMVLENVSSKHLFRLVQQSSFDKSTALGQKQTEKDAKHIKTRFCVSFDTIARYTQAR